MLFDIFIKRVQEYKNLIHTLPYNLWKGRRRFDNVCFSNVEVEWQQFRFVDV